MSSRLLTAFSRYAFQAVAVVGGGVGVYLAPYSGCHLTNLFSLHFLYFCAFLQIGLTLRIVLCIEYNYSVFHV